MKTISINIFDSKRIDEATKAIEDMRKEYEDKIVEFKHRLAEEICVRARMNYASAWYNDIIYPEDVAFKKQSVNVSVDWQDNNGEVIITVNGSNAVWVEFGTGVYYNGAVGSRPHPWGDSVPCGIGEYGFGLGKNPFWWFNDFATRGTEAQMPLYNAVIEVEQIAGDIAREVFND